LPPRRAAAHPDTHRVDQAHTDRGHHRLSTADRHARTAGGTASQPEHDSSRYDTQVRRICGAPRCGQPIVSRPTGRPARFCSAACRVRAYRQRERDRGPLTVEVDHGSASSRGRRPDRAWLVRLRRADRSVIVAIGLSRAAADRLAGQIADLLG
jgi:hypothetical protein